jgi:hypothetical protein
MHERIQRRRLGWRVTPRAVFFTTTTTTTTTTNHGFASDRSRRGLAVFVGTEAVFFGQGL